MRLLLMSCLLVSLLPTAYGQDPGGEPYTGPCGFVSTTNYLTCRTIYGQKNTVTCTSSGRCNDEDECIPRPGYLTTGQNTFPVANWDQKFYSIDQTPMGNGKKILSQKNKCFELLNCRFSCAKENGNSVCKQGSELMAEGIIYKVTEGEDCPPLPPPKDPVDNP